MASGFVDEVEACLIPNLPPDERLWTPTDAACVNRMRRQKARMGLPCVHDEHYQGSLRGAVDPGEMARDARMSGVRERSGCAHQNHHRSMESVALSGLP